MDEEIETGKMIVIKVSVVNEFGHTLMDSLVAPEVPISRLISLERIHGISHSLLKTQLDSLPTIEKVRAFIKDLIVNHQVIIVG
jgi:hypothetical protein